MTLLLSWLYWWPIPGTLLSLWLSSLLYRKLRQRLHHVAIKRRHDCQDPPSYSHKDRLFGITLFLKYKQAFEEHNFLDFNTKLFDQYGKTFQATRLGGGRVIKTMDPLLTKYVHATYFDHFGVENIRSGAEYLWGDGITVVDGDKWAARRKLIKPSFDVAHVANLQNRSLAQHVERFMTLVPRDGSTVDLMPLLRRLNLDTASEFIFGKSMDALRSPDAQKEFLDAYFYANRGTAIRLMLGPKLRFLHRDKKWWRDCDTVNSFLDKHVEEALARRQQRQKHPEDARNRNPQDKFCLIDEMAKATQNKLTLRFQMQNVFTPAHDGAAVTLSNALFHLSRNPQAWAKLRAEMLPTKHVEPVTYDLLKTYQYLKRVIRETHRVTPISTLISRQCVSEEGLILPTGGGAEGNKPLYLRKGDVVEMNFRATLRDKSFWGEDADVFRPERWEDPNLKPTWEYTPFGGGPRVCPGFRLIFAEVAYVLVTLVREFKRLGSRDERPWTEETRATFQNANGCLVALFAD